MIEILPVFLISFFGIFLNVWLFVMLFDKLMKPAKNISSRLVRLPKISILIPAHNEAASIGKTLRSAFALNYPKDKLEVIVIDNASTDGTADAARRFRRAKVLRIKEMGKAVALEKGFEKSGGDVIGVLDADTFVSRNALKKMIVHFADPQVGAVTNMINIDKESGVLSRFQKIEYTVSGLIKKILSTIDALYITPGTLSLIRREAVKEIGFSGDTLTEDMDMALSLIKKDYRIFHCLDARVRTVVPKTLKDWVSQRIRWYRGYMENMMKHRDLIFGRRNVVLGWFVIPIAGLLSVAIGIYTTLYMFGDFSYGLFAKMSSLQGLSLLDQLTLISRSFSEMANFIYNPYALMLFLVVFSTSMAVIMSFLRRMKGARRVDIAFVPLYMVVYYTIIMIYWLVSVFYEFSKRGRTW